MRRPSFLKTRSVPKVPRSAGKPVWLSWYGMQPWRKRAAAQLREEPLCAHCRPKIVEAKIADHVEHHRGDPEAFWNGELQSLCWSCHSAKSRADQTGRPQRRIKGCDPAGFPLDPVHHWRQGSD